MLDILEKLEQSVWIKNIVWENGNIHWQARICLKSTQK